MARVASYLNRREPWPSRSLLGIQFPLKLLIFLFLYGSAVGQRQPSRFSSSQFRPRSSIDYDIDYKDLPPLDDTLFADDTEDFVVLPRAPLEERQGEGFFPLKDNNRPSRNPALDQAPNFNIPFQEVEPPRPSLARSPIQERPVYQIPTFKAPPPQYKPQGRPVNKPDRNSYNPKFKRELEKEEDEPDKLSLLLRQTKFDCIEKGDGYYADDSLNCEVFHVCQDRVRTSWICPEDQIFHQVHLICMPQTDDTVCKESSNFYFVNDYLHQPPITDDFNKTIDTILQVTLQEGTSI